MISSFDFIEPNVQNEMFANKPNKSYKLTQWIKMWIINGIDKNILAKIL